MYKHHRIKLIFTLGERDTGVFLVLDKYTHISSYLIGVIQENSYKIGMCYVVDVDWIHAFSYTPMGKTQLKFRDI